MAINQCTYSFLELAQEVLPRYMSLMRKSLENPTPVREFLANKRSFLLYKGGQKSDFQGCYVLLENGQPIYVGISRKLVSRLLNHFTGPSHNTATLAFAIARAESTLKGKRDALMADQNFLQEFGLIKQRLHNGAIAFIPIESDLELYLFEAYCAMELDTYQWNTFRTH